MKNSIRAFPCLLLAAGIANAASYTLSNEASCLALPAPATWTATGSLCTLNGNLSLAAGDMLTVTSPVMLVVPAPRVLSNAGTLSLPIGGRLAIRGTLNNNPGGVFNNNGFWDVRDATSIVFNSVGATINSTNQLQLSNGRLENLGTFNANGSVSVSIGAVFANVGTMTNNGTITNAALFENRGSLNNAGTFNIGCPGAFINSGVLTGNPVNQSFCWQPTSDSSWFNGANWNLGTPPTPGADITINNATNGPVIDADLTFSGSLNILIGQVRVAPGATLTNDGEIRNNGGQLPGVSTLRNQGTLINNGSILNANQVIIDGHLSNHGTIGGGNGPLINNGTIVNEADGEVDPGGMDNRATGVIVNKGRYVQNRSQNDNRGEVINEAGATLIFNNRLRNFSGASLVNEGQLSFTHDLTLASGLDNESGAVVENAPGATLTLTEPDVFINNFGLIRNNGAIANAGIVTNSRVICGTGTISGNAVVGNPPIAACAPVANAGPDRVVGEGLPVTLDGVASSTPKGLPLAYAWTQVAGPAVTLSAPNAVQPTFLAPFVSGNQILTFRLTVNDGYDTSAPDFVSVMVNQTNNPPVADAGDDRTAKPGSMLALDSSHSFDPDGDAVTEFLWTQVAGPPAALTPGSSAPAPMFMVPFAVGSSLVFKLAASDGREWSAPSAGADSSQPDTVAIHIVENSRPVAMAGQDRAVGEGTPVVLDGGASHDPDAEDTITYAWTQTAGPPVVLNNAGSATPSFTAPYVAPGGATLTFRLVVRDNDRFNPLDSLAAFVNVGVYNVNDPPRCDLAAPSEASLWPANGGFSPIGILGITDDGLTGMPFTVRITGVMQDEPTSDPKGRDLSPDAIIVPGTLADTVQIRRERENKGNGRVYTIAFTADDGREGCSSVVRVSVPPHRNGSAVDDGPAHDSTLP